MDDGTVPRGSAIPWEWTDATAGRFSSARHSSLQNAQGTIDQVVGLLDPEDDAVFGAAVATPQEVAMDVEPLYEHGEPIAVRARVDSDDVISCRVVNVDDGSTVGPVEMLDHVDGGDTATISDLPQGVYRFEVGSARGSLSEVVTVLQNVVPDTDGD